MSIVGYEDLVEQIKSRCDIVEVVGRTVALKRAGSNYKGLCPFHGEKTPSFVVSQEKQIFTCFGCGATGDVIEFVKHSENLDFNEAVEKLAQDLGIEIKRTTHKFDEKKDGMYDITREAARFFYKNLRTGDNPGIRYVMKREIDPETAKKFGIGYAKDGWQSLEQYFQQKGTPPDKLEELGLISKGKKGYYDKFRNRVIFPIMNIRGKVIGFGGRAIDGETSPKYLNSPESMIFKKKNNLYGLNLARKEISRQNLAILVEGYMDVVSLFRYGVENVVATLGTALTHEQAELLKRYTDQVVLSYDSDSAGQAATLRGIDILQEAGLKVKILMIEGGKDPDEYIKKNGKESFEILIKQAISFMEYKINGIKSKYDMNTTDGSIRFLEEIAVELKKVKSPVEQAAYIKMVAELTKIPASSITREIEGNQAGKQVQWEPAAVAEQRIKSVKTERKAPHMDEQTPLQRILIRLMLTNGAFIEKVLGTEETKDFFAESAYAGIAKRIFGEYKSEEEIDVTRLRDNLEDEEAALLEEILQNVLPQENEEKTFEQCIEKIQINHLAHRRNDILNILQILDEDTDQAQIEALTMELMKISKLMKDKM